MDVIKRMSYALLLSPWFHPQPEGAGNRDGLGGILVELVGSKLSPIGVVTTRDQICQATSTRINEGRAVSGSMPIPNKSTCIRPDLMLIMHSIEFDVSECGKDDQNSLGKKEIMETKLLCPKTMKDMFQDTCSDSLKTLVPTHGCYIIKSSFFIDRVVPILNYFADNVGIVCFEWGEKKILSRQAVTLSIMQCEGETPNYADGIGNATRAGILDDERILVECSSGGLEENLQHTYGDSLKILELRTTKRCHPSQFSEIAEWMSVFQLLAHWMDLVLHQEEVGGLLCLQHTGIESVEDGTISEAFKNCQLEFEIADDV
ncbi:hypothetical protein O0I10_012542 [Lichtheimia ornata]|uniref:Uncharacterized protein n=1 Tax=Lichtheimia ornata TaxID=688661 RepID=A0AAD7UQV8_9FUNG|nr:uncharacterized protein O0I10_012542 [Lichtheimia ornata]KAJ8651897.1 hypothetical protein O0I10_012542 [Lichtheimia ornata]